MKSVFNTNNKKSTLDCKIFLDDQNNGISMLRFDQLKYPKIQKFREIQESFFWRPMEIELQKDQRDYKSLTDAGKHIFRSNILFQTMLDSVQTIAPSVLFSTITTLPEVLNFCAIWQFQESIHSFSYSYILRNVLNDPSELFDQTLEIKEIVERANSITKYYDDLYHYNQYVDLFGYDKDHTKYEHKKKIWLALMTANLLEGVRFYVSFACSWAFAEQKLMIGNATEIKFICKDENIHLGFTQYLLKTLPKDDPDFITISQELENECINMFIEAVDQEKEWAKYLFKHGSILGLNERLLSDYIEWIAKKRMDSIGLKCPWKTSVDNPLPWTQNWISGKDVQQAQQEGEGDRYLIGALDKSKDKRDILKHIKKFELE